MVYGWSWKNWNDHYLIAFDNPRDAERWLQTPESDFREREIVSETKARELAGEYWQDWDGEHKLHLTS